MKEYKYKKCQYCKKLSTKKGDDAKKHGAFDVTFTDPIEAPKLLNRGECKCWD